MPSSLYIHLPFCKTKCPYCDFASFTDLRSQEYWQALFAEIDWRMQGYQSQKQELQTIFFGGGTPSIHSPEELSLILDYLRLYFFWTKDAEISIEINPGTVDQTKLNKLLDIGINRFSLGVQSFDEKVLAKLARGHSLEDSHQVLKWISQLNLKSWSLDLIYGLPEQDLDSWKNTLDIALTYKPPHISAYALSIEEATPFGKLYGNSYHPDLPEQDLVADMYELAVNQLQTNQLLRYEISNFARLGHEAKHNLTYWKADEYWAFGISAHGYVNRRRYANTRDYKQYINLQFEESFSIIDPQEATEEQLLLGLRLRDGVIINTEINSALDQDALQKYLELGYISLENNNLRLNPQAFLQSNKIIGDLIK